MQDKNKREPRVGLRPFAEILTDLGGGDVERELTTQVAEVVRACEATKKKGKITITLNIAPGPKMMQMSADIKTTCPRQSLESTAFYTDDKGGLHIENPRQQKLFDGPKAVAGPTNDGEN